MNITVYEQGQIDLVGMVLEKRFGPLSTQVREQLEKLSEAELVDLALMRCLPAPSSQTCPAVSSSPADGLKPS